MLVLLTDATAPILDGRPFFVVAALVLLLGIGVRVWLAHEGGSIGELAATRWLGRVLIGGGALLVLLLIWLLEWVKSHS